MRFTVAARVSLIGCAICLSWRVSVSSARLTTFSADPPLLVAFAPSDADQSWLSKANPECQQAFRHAGDCVLAVEETFLRTMRKHIANIDAASPCDDFGPAANDTTASEARPAWADADEDGLLPVPETFWADESADFAGALPDQFAWEADDTANADRTCLWRAVITSLWGSPDDESSGLIRQTLSFVSGLTANLSLPALDDMNVLAWANTTPGEPAAEFVEPAADGDESDLDTPPVPSWDDDFLPVQDNGPSTPHACPAGAGFSSATSDDAEPRICMTWPVNRDATEQPAIGTATMGGLLDRISIGAQVMPSLWTNTWTKAPETTAPINLPASPSMCWFTTPSAPQTDADNAGDVGNGNLNNTQSDSEFADPSDGQARVEWEYED